MQNNNFLKIVFYVIQKTILTKKTPSHTLSHCLGAGMTLKSSEIYSAKKSLSHTLSHFLGSGMALKSSEISHYCQPGLFGAGRWLIEAGFLSAKNPVTVFYYHPVYKVTNKRRDDNQTVQTFPSSTYMPEYHKYSL